MIVVIEVRVAEREAEQTLADQRLQAVLDQLGRLRVAAQVQCARLSCSSINEIIASRNQLVCTLTRSTTQ